MAIDLNGSTGISLDDNEKINIGNDSDLQIYHDGTHSYVDDSSGTGRLILKTDYLEVQNAAGNEAILGGIQDGAVSLFYNGNTKIATTSTGIDVTGNATFADNGKAIFGAGSDLQIYHDGSDSRIIENGTGDLYIGGASNMRFVNSAVNATYAMFTEGGKVQLNYNDSKRFETTDAGVTVTGKATLTSGELTFSGSISDPNGAAYIWRPADNTLAFGTANEERMRLDGSGNFMFGKTNIQDADSGFVIESSGFTNHHRDSGTVSVFDRGTNDGQILSFRKDGTVHGSIGKGGSGFFIAGVASTDFGVVFDGGGLLPSNDDGVLRDNSDNLGHPSYRWEDAFITNGVTTGSDANDKQDIATLTATEMLVAARLSQTFQTYRWKDAVVSKGDSARTHTGTIAQEVQAAFTAEGLDAGDYAMFMSDTWLETQTEVPAVEAVAKVTDEDGNVTTEAVEAKDAYTRTDTYETEAEAPEGATSKTRLGIRYPELLSFVAAYNEQRFASIEARLTALEA